MAGPCSLIAATLISMNRERAIVLVLFFFSGATGLVYEVVWTRQLGLLFGVSIFATSAVLAAFMGGLGLGSFLYGRLVSARARPVRVYALLELGIGLSALVVGPVLANLAPLYVTLARALEDHFLLFNLSRALLAIAVLLVPTTLMGATVPAIAGYLIKQRDRVGWNTGLLYAANTFGAFVGCISAGFALVPTLGLSTTVYTAAAVNLTIAAVILVGGIASHVAMDTNAIVADTATTSDRIGRDARIAIGVFALSGLAALGFEVIWTRAMVIHVHNTNYAFAVMLGTFLAGLALGDVLLVRFYDRIRRPLVWLGGSQLLVALSVVLTSLIYASLRTLSLGLVDQPSTFGSAILLVSLRAGLVLLPSTLILGITFPLVARIVCSDLRHVSRSLGRAYAANTWGAVAGSLITAFVLIPTVGVRGSLALLSGLSAVLGGVCLVASASTPRSRGLWAAASLAVALVPAFAIPKTLLTDAYASDQWKLIHYREGVTDSTGVYEHVASKERFLTYGDLRGTSGTFTASLGKREGHLTHLLHPNPTRSLQIGFGVGNTLSAVALHPEVEQLDCAELSPHVRETAPFFWTNDAVIDDPKVRMIIDDGRNFLLRTQERYQVIGLDPPEIFTADVVNLYTREFYELAYDALTDDGLVLNWIPTYTMGELELRMLVRSVLDVFPETSLWLQGPMVENGNPLSNMLLIVGSKRPLRIDLENLTRRMHRSPVRESLEAIETARPEELLGLYLGGSKRLRKWVEDVPAVVDDHTRVDFSSPMLPQAGFGFGMLRVFEPIHLLAATHVKHNLDMAILFQSLREPIESILADGPGRDAIVKGVADQRRRYDREVLRLKSEYQVFGLGRAAR